MQEEAVRKRGYLKNEKKKVVKLRKIAPKAQMKKFFLTVWKHQTKL